MEPGGGGGSGSGSPHKLHVSVFCTGKKYGQQDPVILVLRWSREQQTLKNLSWFRPLCGCNTILLKSKTEASIRVPRMFKSHT
jgi:hypothetical protein